MKRKYKIISYLLALSMSLSNCGKEYNPQLDKGEIVYSYDENNDQDNNKKNGIDEFSQKYIDYFDSYKSKYSNLEHYLGDDEVDYISSHQRIRCDYTFDGDIENLIAKIKLNSKKYIKDNPKYKDFFDAENTEALYNVINTIINTCSNDLNEDMHKFSDLKIVFGDTESFTLDAIYNHFENIIIINDEAINAFINVGEDRKNALEYLLQHELNHARQCVCDCRSAENVYDIRYSEYETFMLESSAESDLINRGVLTYDVNAYEDERKNESELFLLALFNDNVDDYYTAVFDTNIQSLYKFYNLSDNEYGKFYNIIYNMDALLLRNVLPFDLTNNYTSWDEYNSVIYNIGFNYKLELFNMALKRLIIYSSTNDLSLKENLIMYNIIKNTLFNTYELFSFDVSFISDFVEIDNKYIEYLIGKYNVDIDQIRKMEYIDVRVVSVCINELINGLEITNPCMIDVANYYINKYPMLNNIMKKTNIFDSNISIRLNKDAYHMFK